MSMIGIQFAPAKNQYPRITRESFLSSITDGALWKPCQRYLSNTPFILHLLPTLAPGSTNSSLDCATLASKLDSSFSHLPPAFFSRQQLEIPFKNINQIISLPCLKSLTAPQHWDKTQILYKAIPLAASAYLSNLIPFHFPPPSLSSCPGAWSVSLLLSAGFLRGALAVSDQMSICQVLKKQN